MKDKEFGFNDMKILAEQFPNDIRAFDWEAFALNYEHKESGLYKIKSNEFVQQLSLLHFIYICNNFINKFPESEFKLNIDLDSNKNEFDNFTLTMTDGDGIVHLRPEYLPKQFYSKEAADFKWFITSFAILPLYCCMKEKIISEKRKQSDEVSLEYLINKDNVNSILNIFLNSDGTQLLQMINLNNFLKEGVVKKLKV